MQSIYNLVIRLSEKLLPISGLFSEKMKLFVDGRKSLFSNLERKILPEDHIIWLHAASLGEYEQAVPVIKEIRKLYPAHKIVLSFFSPSGYEIKKSSELVDIVTYLPLDTPKNVRKFLDIVHPQWALFIKYEFWPNFLMELKKRKTRTLLISGSFRQDQVFFKPYGKWMRTYLNTFEHFFVQNKESQDLLGSIGFENTTVSGDTRFDRVAAQITQDNNLPFISEFKNGKLCIVAGSTWPQDEELLIDFINQSPDNLKFIIAPHTLKPSRIEQLWNSIKKKKVKFSEKENKNLIAYQVFIIDTIGLLTKIYSYADIAYVGGGAGDSGLHNILEPATFRLPILIGKNYSRFPEAVELKKLGGLYSTATNDELNEILQRLTEDSEFREKTGAISETFIRRNTGASTTIAKYLNPLHQKE